MKESFREEHALPDGERVVLRYIQQSDAGELRRQFLALSPETRYRRFFGAIEDLDARTLEYLTNVDGVDHVAIVAVMESLDLKTERGIGVARFVRTKEDPKVAEMAVTVVDDMQGKGVGTLLSHAAVNAALARGIERFRCVVLADNEVVVKALREVGAVEKGSEAGTIVFDVPIAAVAQPSIVRRLLRLAAEQMNAFLRRLMPPDLLRRQERNRP
ncbi:MAG TPA: GNAT family N-acetyltransferase [Polyangiaceae bacterium]|nr:GNAT family N-acetyltransferase [Polyangiaceae bacterium]